MSNPSPAAAAVIILSAVIAHTNSTLILGYFVANSAFAARNSSVPTSPGVPFARAPRRRVTCLPLPAARFPASPGPDVLHAPKIVPTPINPAASAVRLVRSCIAIPPGSSRELPSADGPSARIQTSLPITTCQEASWTSTQRVDSLPKTGHTGRARRPDRPSTHCSRSGTHALGVERLPATCQEPLMPVPSIAFPTDPRERLPRQVWCRYPAPYRARPSPRSPQPPYPKS